MDKEKLMAATESKELHELNEHQLRSLAGDAVQRVQASGKAIAEARTALGSAMSNLPAAAKMAAGSQLDAAFSAVNALADGFDALAQLVRVFNVEATR